MAKHEQDTLQGHATDKQGAANRPAAVRFGRLRARLRARGPIAFAYHFYWVEHQAADLASGIAFRLLINLFPLFGVSTHLVRDMATGGVPLRWPRDKRRVRIPYALYLALLTVAGVNAARGAGRAA